MGRAGGFRAKSCCVLEDAFGTGIVNELFASNEALFHRDLAPGAETVGQFRQRYVGGCCHARHSLRPLRTLSTDRVGSGGVLQKKVSISPLT